MSDQKPLKRFGQNFLVDENIIKKIIYEINPQKEDAIIEIGPGNGALTKHLYSKVKKLMAFEIDKRKIDELRSNFPGLNLYQEDFTKINIKDYYQGQKLRIVGNIPYNITSPIIFKLLNSTDIISDAVLMVQYEVAKRMVAGSGSKDYGIYSVLLNYFADTKLRFKVSPNVFYPKPKVYSAIVHITIKDTKQNVDPILFKKIVKLSFAHRRKTLKNSLSNSILEVYNLSNSPVDISKRAEQLSIKDFELLTNFIKKELDAQKD